MDIHNRRIHLISIKPFNKGAVVKYLKYIKIPAVLILILFLTACKLGGR